MPSTSKSQQRTARVALAVKHGKVNLDDLEPAGFRDAVQSMAQMSASQLEDFTALKRTRTVMSGRRRAKL